MEKLLIIYCLLDKATETKSQHMLLDGEREVKSTYTKFMIENPNSMLSQYAQDFDIYQLGTINIETGKVTEDMKQICNLSCLKPETKE